MNSILSLCSVSEVKEKEQHALLFFKQKFDHGIFFPTEKKSSNNDKNGKVSILDRILQNIGRYEDSLELRGKWPRICRSPAGRS